MRVKGPLQWAVATVLAAAVLAVASAMAYPMPLFSALGLLHAVALSFPLHLLVGAALALALAALARPHRSAIVLLAAALGSAALALWPSLSLWQYARERGVAVSLGDYLANAGHLNLSPVHPERSAVYATTPDGVTLRLDIWPAPETAGGSPHPAVVRVHGGAFISGHRGEMPDWDRWFNSLGYTVFDVDYRLPPPVRWRDEIGDVKCALGWVVAHAGETGIDPARISITGQSAGATLAMLAAYSAGDPRVPASCDAPPVTIRSVINLYGVADMPALYDTGPSRALVDEAATRYIGGSPAEYPKRHAAVSPMTYIGLSAAPTISFLGASDRIIPASQLSTLDDALKRAGVVSEAYLLPASDHGFDIDWGGFATQFARAKIAEFLRRYP